MGVVVMGGNGSGWGYESAWWWWGGCSLLLCVIFFPGVELYLQGHIQALGLALHSHPLTC